MAAQDLCSLAEVRAFLELPQADTGRDALISSTITPISDAISRYCQREFVPTASATRRFRLDVGLLKLDLAPYDLRTATTVSLHPETAAPVTLTPISNYQLHPITAPYSVYTAVRFAGNQPNLFQSDSARYFGYAQVDITGAWGFSAIPADVKQAAIIAVASAVRKDIPSLDLADFSEPRQLQPDRPINYALPAASLRMLGPFRRFAFQ